MGLEIEYIDGQTPINEEEKAGLKIKSISTQGELDDFEQINIDKAWEWILKKKFTANTSAALFDSANPLAFDLVKFNFIKLLPDRLIFIAGFQTKTPEQFWTIINKLIKVVEK